MIARLNISDPNTTTVRERYFPFLFNSQSLSPQTSTDVIITTIARVRIVRIYFQPTSSRNRRKQHPHIQLFIPAVLVKRRFTPFQDFPPRSGVRPLLFILLYILLSENDSSLISYYRAEYIWSKAL